MEKTTHEIILPDSQAKVVFYDFLSTGDVRKIRRAIAETMLINVKDGDAIVAPISGGVGMAQEDIVLECVIKEIIYEGAVVSDVKQFIYDLSIKDGDLIYSEANRISTDSELSKEAKKK